MTDWQLKTPVAFIIFNRPDTTELVFAEIAKAKPPKLLVIADGPRTNRPGEAEKCAATRAIIEQVDWPCEVLTNFSDRNLGCKLRVSSGINWVFEQVEEAIILEDDCLPHPTFFRFCEEFLNHYRHDARIGMISGDNFQFGQNRTDASYYYSRYNHIWGWASWKRAWKHYDVEANAWPTLRDDGWLNFLLHTQSERQYWTKVFQAVHDGLIDSWAYQWTLASWSQGMISVIPNINLISNIGFGGDATHTRGASIYADLKIDAINFPLDHPRIVLPHHEADAFTARGMFTTSLPRRVLQKTRRVLQKIRALIP